jgi:predicted Zn-dependent protease
MLAVYLDTPMTSTVTFTDASDVLYDPTEVLIYLRRPFAAAPSIFSYTEAEVIRLSQGVFKYDWVADTRGYWVRSWRGTATTFFASTPVVQIFVRSTIQT